MRGEMQPEQTDGFCWARTPTGKAKSAVAHAIPFFILVLLYNPMR